MFAAKHIAMNLGTLIVSRKLFFCLDRSKRILSHVSTVFSIFGVILPKDGQLIKMTAY